MPVLALKVDMPAEKVSAEGVIDADSDGEIGWTANPPLFVKIYSLVAGFQVSHDLNLRFLHSGTVALVWRDGIGK